MRFTRSVRNEAGERGGKAGNDRRGRAEAEGEDAVSPEVSRVEEYWTGRKEGGIARFRGYRPQRQVSP